MSMLTHRLEQPFDSSRTKGSTATGLTTERRKAIKRICLRATTVLLVGGVLAGLIGLKTAIFFWRFGYS